MANQVFRALGTPTVFRDSSGDVVITLQNLAFGAGRVSARWDRGAGSLPRLYEWRAVVQFETAPALNEVVEIYLFDSDGTYMTGTLGTSDAALTAAKKVNGKLIGTVVVDTTSVTTDIIASGMCWINSRYISVGVWNASAGDNLENTANASRVILTPMADEIQ